MRKALYIAPKIEVITIGAELGFTGSIATGNGLGDYTWGSETEDE